MLALILAVLAISPELTAGLVQISLILLPLFSHLIETNLQTESWWLKVPANVRTVLVTLVNAIIGAATASLSAGWISWQAIGSAILAAVTGAMFTTHGQTRAALKRANAQSKAA
jgi:hypothetical protein